MLDDLKVQVLLSAAEERNRAMHIMRERIQKTCIWILGIFLASAGWIIQGNVTLTFIQKTYLAAVIVVAVIVVRAIFLRDIESGFKGQQRALARIEIALKLYEPGFYDGGEDCLFPESWRHAGTECGGGRFFTSNYWILYVGAVVLLAALLSQGTVY